MLIIDTHVQLRDFTEKNAESLLHGLQVAQSLGIAALIEMPNTSPPLTQRSQIMRRLEWADYALSQISPYQGVRPFHALYAGLSGDQQQLAEMIALQQELPQRIVGFKMDAGRATTQLGVCHEEADSTIYRILAENDYCGMLVVDCEKEELFQPELWQLDDVASHSKARPIASEVAAIEEQLELARLANFRGQLHIAHISTAEGVELVEKARTNQPFRVSCGVTPHHLCLNTASYSQSSTPLYLKVNPPLRPAACQQQLWRYFLAGKIDWLESDHAPHTVEDKQNFAASGIPGLPFLRLFVDELRRRGIDSKLLDNTSALNAYRCFKLPCIIDDELPPISPEQWQKLLASYPTDPYAQLLEQELLLIDGLAIGLT